MKKSNTRKKVKSNKHASAKTSRVLGYVLSVLLFGAGVFITFWPGIVKEIIIKILAVVLILIGIFFYIKFLFGNATSVKKKVYSISGGALLLFGILMIIFPKFFFGFIQFILGAVICALGVYSIISLFKKRKEIELSKSMYIFPVIMVLLGVGMFFYPAKSTNVIFVISGVILMLYGIFGCIETTVIGKKLLFVKDTVSLVTGEIMDAAGSMTDEIMDAAGSMTDVVNGIKDKMNT